MYINQVRDSVSVNVSQNTNPIPSTIISYEAVLAPVTSENSRPYVFGMN